MPIRTLTFVALCLVSACSGGQPAPRAGTTPPPTSASPSTNQAPEIVVLPLTALAGERYANQILASDTEGDTLSFTLENAPGWLQLSSSGFLTGTPDEDDVGELSITIVASDPYQTARAVFSLTVELEPLRFALRTGDIRPFKARHGKQTPSLLLDEIRAEHALQKSSPTPPSMSLEQVVFALEQLVSGTLSYDISMCRNAFDCSENAAFHFDIWVPFWEMSYELSEFERGGGSFFPAAPSQKLLALFVLLGDYYRSDVRFPIDKDRTSSDTFVKALYADASSTVRREINPAPRDLGNYSRTDFEGVARSSQTVRLISLSSFRTAGVYAFPGEAFQVTRRDQSAVDVYIQVQSIRDIANHPFRGDYNRPVKIASHQIPIGPGETRVLTSPYGGPVHVYFGDGEHQVELEFQNIGQHPVWRADEETESFLIALAADEFDWAEFVTPYFEVHARGDRMEQTLVEPHISHPQILNDRIETYFRDWPHWLAGQQGPGIRPNPDLSVFAAEHGLAIPTSNFVKHMNADQAGCGAGCSGNPYDAFWSFDPLSQSDLHELGHGLEFRSLHSFEGGDPIHSTTDLYAFHSQYRYVTTTGANDVACRALPHRELYQLVQARIASNATDARIEIEQLGAANRQNVIFVQLMAALQNQGVLEDGWQFMPRLNIVSHGFTLSYANNAPQVLASNGASSSWAKEAPSFGFGGIAYQTVGTFSQNDWLLVAMSWAAQRDLRGWIDMWGYETSQYARNHVAQFGFEPLQPAFYAISGGDLCHGLNHPALPLDGISAWPQSNSAASKPVLEYEHQHDETCLLLEHPPAFSSPASRLWQKRLEGSP